MLAAIIGIGVGMGSTTTRAMAMRRSETSCIVRGGGEATDVSFREIPPKRKVSEWQARLADVLVGGSTTLSRLLKVEAYKRS